MWLFLTIFIPIVYSDYQPNHIHSCKRASLYLAQHFPPDSSQTVSTVKDPTKYSSDVLRLSLPYGLSFSPSSNHSSISFKEYLIEMHTQYYIDHIKHATGRSQSNSHNSRMWKSSRRESCFENGKDGLLNGKYVVEQSHFDRGLPFTIPFSSDCWVEKNDGRSMKRLWRIEENNVKESIYYGTVKHAPPPTFSSNTVLLSPKQSTFVSILGSEFSQIPVFPNGKRHSIGEYTARGMYENLLLPDSIFWYSMGHDGTVTQHTDFKFADNKTRISRRRGTYVWSRNKVSYDEHSEMKIEDESYPIVHNMDVFLSGKHEKDMMGMRWDEYKEKKENEEKSNTSNGVTLEVFWEEWGCCSACCCKNCGPYTVVNCDLLESLQRRRGYYVYKLTKDFKLPFPDLIALFKVEPYRSKGIPVASSLWLQFQYEKRTIDSIFELDLVKYHPVLFETRPCATGEKEDCNKWDRCHNAQMGTEEDSKIEEKDFCATAPFQRMKISEVKTILIVESGKGYRLEIDRLKFPEANEVSWTANSELYSTMNEEMNCKSLETPFIHPNNRDFLIPVITSEFIRKTLEASWESGSVKVHFQVKGDAKGFSQIAPKLFLWIGLVTAFIILLGVFVCVVHRMKKEYALRGDVKKGAVVPPAEAPKVPKDIVEEKLKQFKKNEVGE